MCAGRRCLVVAVDGDETVTVDDGGRRMQVATLALSEPASVGEWVLVYAGLALARLDDDPADPKPDNDPDDPKEV